MVAVYLKGTDLFIKASRQDPLEETKKDRIQGTTDVITIWELNKSTEPYITMRYSDLPDPNSNFLELIGKKSVNDNHASQPEPDSDLNELTTEITHDASQAVMPRKRDSKATHKLISRKQKLNRETWSSNEIVQCPDCPEKYARYYLETHRDRHCKS